MAASAQKVRLIAGGWTAALGAAGFVTYRRLNSFEERGPCVREAVELLAASSAVRQTLGGSGLRVAWWPRECQVHGASGRSSASFVVQGDAGHVRVLLAARRRPPATQAEWEAAEDDLDVRERGWRFYLSQPWELKALAFGALNGLRQGPAAEDAVDALPWDIETLVILPGGDAAKPSVLIGDARAAPGYEALCVRRDGEAKSEASRARLRRFALVALAAAAVAGGRRLAKSIRVSNSYGYIRRRLLAHSEVAAKLGPRASVQSSSGTFDAGYINAQMRLVGDAGGVADVEIAATRAEGGKGDWRVVLARMRFGGLTVNLDRGQF